MNRTINALLGKPPANTIAVIHLDNITERDHVFRELLE